VLGSQRFSQSGVGPADKAKEVADLVATTDGIIFHLWSHDAPVPSGNVIIAQSVGHVNLTEAAFKKGAAEAKRSIR
jgi:hypothetical protein